MTVVKTEWVNFDSLIEDIDRGIDVYKAAGPLEDVLYEAFAFSQAHVASPAYHHSPTYQPTGRLHASGHTKSELHGLDAWSGEIIYNARNDQGDGYAIYEYNRGGIHSEFIDGLVIFQERYSEAIRGFLRGSD